MCNTKDLGPRLTVDEINAFNPSPENPLEVECDTGIWSKGSPIGWYKMKIISKVKGGGVDVINEYGKLTTYSVMGSPENCLDAFPSIKDRLGFQVGDEVEAFGIKGVIAKDDDSSIPLYAWFEHTEGGFWFTRDGKVTTWAKEPSLKLIKRPAKKCPTCGQPTCSPSSHKVRKKFYQYIYRSASHHPWEMYSTLLDENCKDSTGTKLLNDVEHKRIEESCQELEVEVKP